MNAPPEPAGVAFAAASADLLPHVARFLSDAGLPAQDLSPQSLSDFELAFDPEGRLVGTAGLDVAGSDALLRSVAVAPDWRSKGLGACLVARREEAARAAAVSSIYLLTTTAEGYFRRLGYADLAREAVPAAIAAHSQFRGLCPTSAKCLGKRL